MSRRATGYSEKAATLGNCGWEKYLFRAENGNSKTSGCYITDACLGIKGLAHADACYELCLVQLFCEEYVAKLPHWGKTLDQYAEKAPRIARAIHVEKDAWRVYLELYERYLLPMVSLIVNGQWEEAYLRYCAMCQDMENRYS